MVELELSEIISQNVDEKMQAILENGCLTSAMGETGVARVTVAMRLLQVEVDNDND